ncbi:MAG: META domain-containing protein, partial [Aeromonas sp.]
MMCIGDAMNKETEFLQKLEKVATYSINGNQLTLSDANKAALLTFNAVPVTK